jgi:hypothetical protein
MFCRSFRKTPHFSPSSNQKSISSRKNRGAQVKRGRWREDTEVGIHGDVYGAVSEDDDVLGEPDGETGRNDGDGCMGRVICIYVPLIHGNPINLEESRTPKDWLLNHSRSSGPALPFPNRWELAVYPKRIPDRLWG